MADHSVQQKDFNLQPGIFVVRYAVAEDIAGHPSICVKVAPGSKDDISVVLPSGDTKVAMLWQPGTGVAVRVMRPGLLSIEVIPAHANASINATVKIDTLVQGEDTYQHFGRQAAGKLDLSTFRLLGHVASRGDVAVKADEWLAGPGSPARIEGIELQWPDKPSAIGIRYAVFGPRSDPAKVPMVRLGAYAGSRGNALPILGLSMELVVASQEKLQLVVEAVFLGSPPARASGDRIFLSGPTKREPLVGLRVTLSSPIQESLAEAPSGEASSPSAEPATVRKALRVFRSRTNIPQA